MISKGPSDHQASYDLMCQMLRVVLLAAVRAGPDATGEIGTVQLKASATLYGLLLAHPIDRLGRCRSCRRPAVLLGRRHRRCRVQLKADYWLHQPDVPLLLSQLASELGLTATDTAATDLDATDVLPRIEPDVGDPPTQPLQTPAVPPTPRSPAGRPDLDHGGAGEHPSGHPAPPGPRADHTGRLLMPTTRRDAAATGPASVPLVAPGPVPGRTP